MYGHPFKSKLGFLEFDGCIYLPGTRGISRCQFFFVNKLGLSLGRWKNKSWLIDGKMDGFFCEISLLQLTQFLLSNDSFVKKNKSAQENEYSMAAQGGIAISLSAFSASFWGLRSKTAEVLPEVVPCTWFIRRESVHHPTNRDYNVNSLWLPGYVYIHIDYTHLEPFCPLLWSLNPPKGRHLFLSKRGSVGFQVYLPRKNQHCHLERTAKLPWERWG